MRLHTHSSTFNLNESYFERKLRIGRTKDLAVLASSWQYLQDVLEARVDTKDRFGKYEVRGLPQ